MINWKLRLRNKATLTALIGILVAAVYQVMAIMGLTPAIEQETITQAIGLVITVLAAFGIVVDPTTSGVGDSEQALGYDEPKPREGANED